MKGTAKMIDTAWPLGQLIVTLYVISIYCVLAITLGIVAHYAFRRWRGDRQ
jgi:hypothetical protein